jgi:hypothetical protein
MMGSLALLGSLCRAASTPAEPATAATGLTLSIYSNTAAAGVPASVAVIASPLVSFPHHSRKPFSAEITGTLVADSAAHTAATATRFYTFDCDFAAVTLA